MSTHIRTKSFVWIADEQGWRPESTPQFNAGGSFLATHDTMEHFNDNPDFTHELLAFGATIYDRVDRDVPDMWKNVTRDMISFVRVQKFEIEKPTREWHLKIAPTDEQYLKKIVGEAKKVCLIVNKDLLASIAFGGPNEVVFADSVPDGKIIEAFRRIEQWVRLGWLVAQRRYHNHSRQEVRDAFMHLAEMIDEDHDNYSPRDGDRMVVRFDLDALSFTINHEAAYRKAA